MYAALAWLGAVIGLTVTGAAVMTAWQIQQKWKLQLEHDQQEDTAVLSRSEMAAMLLMRWTAIDYAALLLFVLGSMLLAADMLAAWRDRTDYPFYHFGYLLSGIAFSLLGMLFMAVRVGIVLWLFRSARSFSPHDHDKPYHANPSE